MPGERKNMSVLKSKRNESTAEYVNVADNIFAYTLWFCTKLSVRFQRPLGDRIMELAGNIIKYAEMANNIRISDEVTFKVRREYLLKARSSVMALDVFMYYVWHALMKNPQGCFTNSKGNTKTPKEAIETLDKMADKLGADIDEFRNKVTTLLDTDKQKFQKG